MTHAQEPVSRVPEPALVRGALVTVTSIIALILGHTIDVSWINTVVDVYAGISALVAGALIRPAVTPFTPGSPADRHV